MSWPRTWTPSVIGIAVVLTAARVMAQPPVPALPPSEEPVPAPAPSDPPADPAATPATPEAAPPAPAAAQPNPAPAAPDAAPPTHYPVMGKAREIRLSDDFAIRLGVQAQVWADSTQDSNREADGSSGAYQHNFFVRRPRVLTGVQIRDRIRAFMLIEGPNLGRATGNPANPKNFDSIALLDAWAEVKVRNELTIAGGLMIVPLSRNGLQGTTTYLGLDVGNTSVAAFSALQQSLVRDTGFQLKGFLANDHLEYRVGVYSGIREPASMMPPEIGATNAPLFSAYVQYNAFDSEKEYVYNGTYYGKKKIVGVSSGVNYQKGTDVAAFYAVSAAAFASIPVNGASKTGGDEIAAVAQYLRYDGKETAPSVPKQNDFLVEAAYYHHASKISVFGKFETALLADAAKVASRRWYGGGLKYHVAENSCNFTFAYNRQEFPEAPTSGMGAKNSTNQFTFAMQVFYY